MLTNPVRIVVGEVGAANKNIRQVRGMAAARGRHNNGARARSRRQVVEVLADDNAKWPWLETKLRAMVAAGNMLIFVSTRAGAEQLSKRWARCAAPARAGHA